MEYMKDKLDFSYVGKCQPGILSECERVNNMQDYK